MIDPRASLIQRAEEYARRNFLRLEERLGDGVHGIVFSTDCQSAIKAHEREFFYRRERDVYLRLQELEVLQVDGASVPQLLNFDDEFWVIEMTIVSRPFVLDFAGAYLDRAPDYPPEVLEEWESEKRELFGERWDDVQSILGTLRRRYGIYMLDVSPGNVSFRE